MKNSTRIILAAACSMLSCAAGYPATYTADPSTLQSVINSCSAGDTVIALPGTYRGQIDVLVSGVTVKSQTKWAAKVVGGSGVSCFVVGYRTGSNIVIDGFEVANSSQNGIALYGANQTIRNCWIHDSGQSSASNGSGINDLGGQGGHRIEYNLIEYNGVAVPSGLPHNHGVYLDYGGCVIRGNVFRYNQGGGMGGAENGAINYYFDNLSYGNGSYSYGGTYGGGATMVFINNTFNDPVAFYTDGSVTLRVTNCIIAGSPTAGSARISGDHNLYSGTNCWVNPRLGLYWLSASAPARGLALPSAHDSVDFFGQPLSTVSDLGAFQHNPTLAADTRTAALNDYWGAAPVPRGTPLLSIVQPNPGNLRVGLRDTSGQTYYLETSPDLVSWTQLTNVTLGGTNLFTQPCSSAQRYYRARPSAN